MCPCPYVICASECHCCRRISVLSGTSQKAVTCNSEQRKQQQQQIIILITTSSTSDLVTALVENVAGSIRKRTSYAERAACVYSAFFATACVDHIHVSVTKKMRRNARVGQTEDPEKTRRPAASSGTIPTCEDAGVVPPGIKHGSLFSGEVSGLTTVPTAAPEFRVDGFERLVTALHVTKMETTGLSSNVYDATASPAARRRWRGSLVFPSFLSFVVRDRQGWQRCRRARPRGALPAALRTDPVAIGDDSLLRLTKCSLYREQSLYAAVRPYEIRTIEIFHCRPWLVFGGTSDLGWDQGTRGGWSAQRFLTAVAIIGEVSEEIWAALNSEVLRADEGIEPGSHWWEASRLTTLPPVPPWLAHSPPTTCDPGSIPGGFTPGFSHVGIVLDDAACRWVFSGYSRFPRPCISSPLHPRISFRVMSGDDGHLRVPAGNPVPRIMCGSPPSDICSRLGHVCLRHIAPVYLEVPVLSKLNGLVEHGLYKLFTPVLMGVTAEGPPCCEGTCTLYATAKASSL
ncbi:hypothetical protein PR048_026233 [Dryococelus australis]|uniref:Uncharacterized protein n=1 Tax=Dryococelus australis TaxID=614101 RepID=A0ABQ9GKR5_9NEOP|nr:hypothetical protein PR048_026233 [Dryococelus australis]